MKERIEAVQRVYWAVLVLALIVIAIGLPLGNDAETMAVLDELTAFHAAFEDNKTAIEQTLLGQAKGAGLVSLADVQGGLSDPAAGPGLPKLSVAKDAGPIEPRATLELGTLARIQALLQPGATLTIASAQPKPLSEAVAWRLARQAKASSAPNESYTLQSIALTGKAAQASDVEREREVARMRRELIDVEKDLADKQAEFQKLDELYESRRKWRATWKVLQRTNEDRLNAKAAMAKAQLKRDKLATSYEQLAKDAESFAGGKEQPVGAPGTTQHVVAIATIAPKSGGNAIRLSIPVALDVRTVPVPNITGADLPITRATDFWSQVKDGTGAQAIEQVRKRFSWHYAYVEVGGVKLGGMTIVQLAPLALIPCLLMLIRRSRRVASSYNPFDRDAGTLPKVGVSPLNIVILVLLPLAGCVLCAMSLIQLKLLPLVPMAVGLAVLGLGVAAHVSLRELSELSDAVRRSHSNPPAAVAK